MFCCKKTPCTCAGDMLKFSCPCFQYSLNHFCRVRWKITVKEIELAKRQWTLISADAFIRSSGFKTALHGK